MGQTGGQLSIVLSLSRPTGKQLIEQHDAHAYSIL